jgi:hypothetical protein
LCFILVPTFAYADETENGITPVTQVNVEFRYFIADPINSNTAIPAEDGGY